MTDSAKFTNIKTAKFQQVV